MCAIGEVLGHAGAPGRRLRPRIRPRARVRPREASGALRKSATALSENRMSEKRPGEGSESARAPARASAPAVRAAFEAFCARQSAPRRSRTRASIGLLRERGGGHQGCTSSAAIRRCVDSAAQTPQRTCPGTRHTRDDAGKGIRLSTGCSTAVDVAMHQGERSLPSARADYRVRLPGRLQGSKRNRCPGAPRRGDAPHRRAFPRNVAEAQPRSAASGKSAADPATPLIRRFRCAPLLHEEAGGPRTCSMLRLSPSTRCPAKPLTDRAGCFTRPASHVYPLPLG